jgi:hypothetical protein
MTIRDLELLAVASNGDVTLAQPLPEETGADTGTETMVKASDAFPSKYLRAVDLPDRDIPVRIDRVVMEDMGVGRDMETKPVIYFKDKTKGVVLNKVNTDTLSAAYGDEMDDWSGHPAIMFKVNTEVKGQPKKGIRFRLPTARDRKGQDDPISSGKPKPDNDMSDEIPF